LIELVGITSKINFFVIRSFNQSVKFWMFFAVCQYLSKAVSVPPKGKISLSVLFNQWTWISDSLCSGPRRMADQNLEVLPVVAD
jgi:hypothetical protein